MGEKGVSSRLGRKKEEDGADRKRPEDCRRTFEGSAFEKPERVHGEFFEILGENELAGRVVARESFSIAREDVDCFFCDGVSDFLQRCLGHSASS